jgi:hypothetical protein
MRFRGTELPATVTVPGKAMYAISSHDVDADIHRR